MLYKLRRAKAVGARDWQTDHSIWVSNRFQSVRSTSTRSGH